MTLMKAFVSLIKFRDARLLLIGSGKDEIKLKILLKKIIIYKDEYVKIYTLKKLMISTKRSKRNFTFSYSYL